MMGLYATASGEVEVRAVPGFRLAVTPPRVVLDYGSVEMVARFTVTIARDAGHDKTVWLDLAGMAGNWSFSSDHFTPGEDAPVTLEINAAGFSVGTVAGFSVVGYDDINDRPPAEVRE